MSTRHNQPEGKYRSSNFQPDGCNKETNSSGIPHFNNGTDISLIKLFAIFRFSNLILDDNNKYGLTLFHHRYSIASKTFLFFIHLLNNCFLKVASSEKLESCYKYILFRKNTRKDINKIFLLLLSTLIRLTKRK